MTSTSTSNGHTKAYIALGSNLGQRIRNIETACNELDAAGLRVLRTSNLYETKPMYVEDQGDFINGACEIKVDKSMSPHQLLAKLKDIENKMGRQKVIDKGPRNIDLDILLHSDHVLQSEELTVPHQSMLDREFVLRPLCDLIPTATHLPALTSTYASLLTKLPPSPTLTSIVPLTPSLPPLNPLLPTRRTHLISILNLTPDSFSDGSLHLTPATNHSSLLPTLNSHITHGATIIDIGGQSTRPHAPQFSATEELRRVRLGLDAVSLLDPEIRAKVTISVDTYRANVAEMALQKGADIINDVSAGLLDKEILRVIACSGKTCVLGHMRGDPSTMNKLTDYSRPYYSDEKGTVLDTDFGPEFENDGLLSVLAHELRLRIFAAESAGIRRWRIMLDPGIGFAKTSTQNLSILRNLNKLRDRPGLQGMAWCVGVSRKGFIGKLTGVKEAKDRGYGTAAAVAAAVQGGADMVRVHDVKEMGEVVRVADGVWRGGVEGL